MKFKVGDMVRPKREYLINAIENNTIHHLEYINGFQVLEIKDDRVFYYINEKDAFYKAEHLELVPEEPEFEYGEEVEVKDDCDSKWYKAIFIGYIPGADKNPKYMTVSSENFEKCKKHEYFTVGVWEYARKLKPKLTRKEIAEKFGVSEDFTLVD